MKSVTLSSPEDKNIVRQAVTTSKIFTAAVAKLHVASPDPSRWTYSQIWGAALFCIDKAKNNSFFIRIVDIQNGAGVIWEQELYEGFQYVKDAPYFHSFETDDCLTALEFVDEGEAEVFYKKVSSRDSLTKNVFSGHKKTPSESNKRKSKIDKNHIGMPADFRHVGHIGYTPGKGFSVQNNNPEMGGIFEQLRELGISAEEINENQEFIQEFLQQNGNNVQHLRNTPSAANNTTPQVHTAPLISSSTPPPPPPLPSSRKKVPPPPPPPGRYHTQQPPPPPPPRRPTNNFNATSTPPPPPPPPPNRQPVTGPQVPNRNNNNNRSIPPVPSIINQNYPPSAPHSAPPPPPPPPVPPMSSASTSPPPPPPPPPMNVASVPLPPMNAAAAPPPPPPPPPSMGAVPPPPPPPPSAPGAAPSNLPSMSDGRSNLMASIRAAGGFGALKQQGKLKKANPTPSSNTTTAFTSANNNSSSAAAGGSLASSLADVLKQRKQAMQSDDEDEDDDEWE